MKKLVALAVVMVATCVFAASAPAAVGPNGKFIWHVRTHNTSSEGAESVGEQWLYQTTVHAFETAARLGTAEVVIAYNEFRFYSQRDNTFYVLPPFGGEAPNPANPVEDPTVGYMHPTRIGKLISKRDLTFAGRPATLYVVKQNELPMLPSTERWILDRTTGYPLLHSSTSADGPRRKHRHRRVIKEVTRFDLFESLEYNAENAKLLQMLPHPGAKTEKLLDDQCRSGKKCVDAVGAANGS